NRSSTNNSNRITLKGSRRCRRSRPKRSRKSLGRSSPSSAAASGDTAIGCKRFWPLFRLGGPSVHRPEANRLVLTCARQSLAIRRESDEVDLVRMSFQGLDELARLRFPEAYLSVRPPGRHDLPIR